MANETRHIEDEQLSGFDRVIEYYKQRVDMEELRRNLAMTVDERLLQLQRKIQALEAKQKGERGCHAT